MKKITMLAGVLALAAAPAFAHDSDHLDKKVDYWFSKMDTDGNGSISKAEHEAVSAKMFTDADTNKDGMVSKDELKAMKMKEMEDMKSSMGDDHTMTKSTTTNTMTTNTMDH